MTGSEFEKRFCKWLSDRGYWALNIPRSKAGQQPFDVVAMNGNFVIVADCKVISGSNIRFPLERIEDNQWLAFDKVSKRTKAFPCIACYMPKYDEMFIIPYFELAIARENKQSSISLDAAKHNAGEMLGKIERLW